MSALSDNEILKLFRDSVTKEEGFKLLLKKYQERLYWHVRRMVVSHEDTNDLLQNISIKIWHALDKFREDSQLYTWLYRIATNECLSFIEQQKKKNTVSISQDEAGYSERVRAEEYFDSQKLEWKLQLAIQQLPEKQRVVFMLRYYEEMPYQQMSEVLGTSEGALKASYHHAAKKIEDYLLNH